MHLKKKKISSYTFYQVCAFPVQSQFKHLGELHKEWTEVEGCIGFGLPRDPMQISWERAVLPLRAGVGGQKIMRESCGEWWDLVCNRNGVNTLSWEEN